MKILLDENLPHQMRRELPGHDIFTAAYLGWAGIKNGRLLQLAADNGFDAVVTNDRDLEYQQNLSTLPVAVIVILGVGSAIEDIRPLIGRLLDALQHLQPRQVVKIR